MYPMKEKLIGPWRLGSHLGLAVWGTVYEATNVSTNERAALKVLLQGSLSSHDSLSAARRLRDEARATAGIEHSGLVKVLDSGDDDELGPYVVYEFMEGNSLRQYLAIKRKMPLKEALAKVVEPLLGALSALHAEGVVHRDVKPENLLRASDDTFKLGDLGLAVFEGREAHTKNGSHRWDAWISSA